MKLTKIEMFAVAIIILQIVMIGFAANKPNSVQNKEVPEKHWSHWSEPRITSDMFDGTTLWQMRTNLDGGEIEMRSKTVSPHGGYFRTQ